MKTYYRNIYLKEDFDESLEIIRTNKNILNNNANDLVIMKALNNVFLGYPKHRLSPKEFNPILDIYIESIEDFQNVEGIYIGDFVAAFNLENLNTVENYKAINSLPINNN